MPMTFREKLSAMMPNLFVGLTVSFIALSLGAAFGVLSGRGAFAGMISTGIIAMITSALGGTRRQCSGPTAPMTAVTAALVAYAFETYGMEGAAKAGVNPDHFVNLVFILAGGILVVSGLLRLGKYIRLVPGAVVSGFMSGIALIMWLGEVETLFGLGDQKPMAGDFWHNVLIMVATIIISTFFGPAIRRFSKLHLVRLVPGMLIAIVGCSAVSYLLAMDVERVALSVRIGGVSDIVSIFQQQIPSGDVWQWAVLGDALPFALKLAFLCYIDTLLTSLIVDKMTGEPTKQNKELGAQGVANAAVGLIGGVPGAQATVWSVMTVREGATMRLAGFMVGVFVIIELLAFQDAITMIPKAVFVGILFKVGWEIFDMRPFITYAKQITGRIPRENWSLRHDDFILVVGTMLATVFYSLNIAVMVFSVLFYLVAHWRMERLHVKRALVEEKWRFNTMLSNDD